MGIDFGSFEPVRFFPNELANTFQVEVIILFQQYAREHIFTWLENTSKVEIIISFQQYAMVFKVHAYEQHGYVSTYLYTKFVNFFLYSTTFRNGIS